MVDQYVVVFSKTKDEIFKDSRVAWSIREPPGLLTRLGDSRLTNIKPRPQTKCLESLGVLVVKKNAARLCGL